MTFQVKLSLRWVIGTLLFVTALLFAIDMFTQYREWNHRHDLQRGYAEIGDLGCEIGQSCFAPRQPESLSPTFEKIRLRFDIDREGTVPTWFSAFLEATIGLLLLALGFRSRQSGGRMFIPWVVIGLIFFYLSIDDTVMLHELLGGDNSIGGELKDKLGIDVAFVWVIPAMIVLIALLPFFIPFFLKLPRGTFLLFVLAGLGFIFSQVVMESYAGNHLQFNTMKYHWESALEDSPGKQVPLILFMFALLAYVRDNLEAVNPSHALVADLPVIRQVLMLPGLRLLRPPADASPSRPESEPAAVGGSGS
jgi:hypothetical protein